MGMRGAGAAVRRLAREELEGRSRKQPLPWKKRGLSRAERVIAFLEFLPVTKGPLAGTRMRLLDEQRAFVEEVYGHLLPNGRRAVRLAIKSEPKGQGKTGLAAGLVLCHLVGPEIEPRGEIYSAAIDRQQAGLIFAECEAIIHGVPEFASRVNIQRFFKKIEDLESGSVYEALSVDARRAHGLAPSLWIYDELAQAKSRELLDNLLNGMGKRAEALGIVISTQAPDDDHPLSQLIDDALTGADPSVFLQLLAAPEDADPWAEETWLACNPALGKFLSLEEMRQAAVRAKRIPAFEPAFRNLRLNQRVDATEDARLVTPMVWKACATPLRKKLLGSVCYGGLDLSGKADLTSLVLVFPDDEGGYDIVPFFWTPLGALAGRRPAEEDLFRQWLKEKLIEPVTGPVIRSEMIARRLGELSGKYDIRAIGYDRWRIEDLKQDLDAQGVELPLHEFGQGFKDMAPAIDYFAELALEGKLRHGGNKVLTACVANAMVVSDPAGNLKIEKGKSNARATVRVDGAVALAMALGTARRFVGEESFDLDDFLANAVVA